MLAKLVNSIYKISTYFKIITPHPTLPIYRYVGKVIKKEKYAYFLCFPLDNFLLASKKAFMSKKWAGYFLRMLSKADPV